MKDKSLGISQRLKILRGSKSQSEVAKMIDVPLRTYQRYESGERLPPSNVIAKIARVFNEATDWILTGRRSAELTGGSRDKGIPQFNLDLILEVIERIETLFEEHDLCLPPRKKAKLIKLLYEEILENESAMDAFDEKVISITHGLAV